MLSSERTVLLMADEALYVYKTKPRSVDLIEELPWDQENFSETISDIIVKKCNKAPVLILNDMVEQHYRKERVVTSGVSFFDRKAMVTRKLNMAFPNYPTRAALPLKEKVKKEAGSIGSDVFIFAAIPNSQQMNQTIAAVDKSLVTSKGMALLPVESAGLVKKLSSKLQDKKDQAAQWVLLIGQHRNGGLRQIVIKNGEIALTRMTPLPITASSDPAGWAKEVMQEFQATMSYLTRFGFRSEDGLDVILLSSPDAAEIVRPQIDSSFNFVSLSPLEAAKKLGLNIKIKDDETCADYLHVSWIASKARLTLPMTSLTLEQVAKPRQIANAAISILALSSLFFAYQTYNYTSLTQEVSDDLRRKTSQNNGIQAQYEAELKKQEDRGIDVRLIQSTLKVYEEFKAENMEPLYMIKGIGEALGPSMRLNAVEIDNLAQGGSDAGANMNFGIPVTPNFLAEAKVQIIYPASADVEKGNQEISDLQKRMQTALPGYTVAVTKFLKDFQYVEEIVVDSGEVTDGAVQQDFIAEITIQKPFPLQEGAF